MKRVTRVRQLIDENFNGRQADFAKAIQDYKGEGIYILATAEGLKVKRLELLLNGRMKVISDNKQHYDPQIINKEDFEHIKICGQVLANWTLNKL